YFLFGILWIFISDLLLFSSEESSSGVFQWELVKGFIFIFVTSLIIYFLLRNYSVKLNKFKYELKKTSNLYKALMDQSTEGVFRLDFDKPVPISLPPDEQIKLIYKHSFFAECNDAMAKMYGYSNAKEMLGVKPE